MYKFLRIKNIVENILLSPFILIGRLIAWFKPLKKEYSVFFIFPFYHTGGVEKVHYNIVQAIGSPNCIIFFTRKSYNSNYLNEFIKSRCDIKNISTFTDNKLLYFLNFIYRGILSGYINSQANKPIVLNGQSNMGYKISPWIRNNVVQIELIHAFNTFSHIRISFLKYYKTSLTISEKVINDHFKLYEKCQIPPVFRQRFRYIENRIELPVLDFTKNYNHEYLKVLYVGRGTEEKRVHLVAQMASSIKKTNPNILFQFAGDVRDSIPNSLISDCILLGDLTQDQLHKVYIDSHILVITSSTESGPLVFMEAMARGNCIISTSVGYIPKHIFNYKTGFILEELYNEKEIVEESIKWIQYMNTNRNSLSEIGTNNITYAFANFGLENFNSAYRNLFAEFGFKVK